MTATWTLDGGASRCRPRHVLLVLLALVAITCPMLDAQEERVEIEPTEETGDSPRSPEEQAKEEDLEEAKETIRQKWHTWLDATQGLVTWDLFNGRLTMQARLKLHIDGTVARESDLFLESFGAVESSVKARRVRLEATGTIDRHLRYVLSYDLGVDRGLKDAYIEGVDGGLNLWGYNVGQFRLGSFKEPFSLERLNSAHNFGMPEWGLPVSTFAPGRNIGYMLHDVARKERMTWAVGFFSLGSREEDNASSSTLSLTARLTGLPIYKDNGKTLLHVGAAFSTRDPRSGELYYRARPEARFAPILVDTGTMDANSNHLLGLELAGVRGPLWLQSEFIAANVESTIMGDLAFWGAYGQVGFFLTGESRPYRRSNGTFSRLIPGTTYEKGVPLKKKSGGAIELTARYSYLDLNDGDVRGGTLKNASLGLNWYLSPRTRFVVSFTKTKTESKGNANIFILRYQYNPR